MERTEVWKIISVFISCALFFGKVGMPAAVSFFKFNFFKSITVSCAGGIFGSVFFTYLSAGLLKWWDRFKHKWFTKHQPKKKFTKANRRIIRIKRRFGLTGIAILSPILLSIPLGAFLGERFYKKKGKVILYLSVSVVMWSFVLYFLFLFFYSAFKSWFD
ncbi:MAG: hypothetical protein JST26_16360 [Bacteroidetes bacterium]|nr:hypothetical protein [Bacteroidota bacterium]